MSQVVALHLLYISVVEVCIFIAWCWSYKSLGSPFISFLSALFTLHFHPCQTGSCNFFHTLFFLVFPSSFQWSTYQNPYLKYIYVLLLFFLCLIAYVFKRLMLAVVALRDIMRFAFIVVTAFACQKPMPCSFWVFLFSHLLLILDDL